ncbi:AAA family ATPase [Cereibacter sphaeroides]|uniref:AAA family ATPase n=1 Tax=Cereibacter sphaeroides TaxID=1063 RepID=UPI001F2C1EEE|nr:AAA family ATPase [Cereibacter sphaeroides]MCE6960586.1 AAA family ATPase [Cereibacter sphaeroides]MCE6972733.1 AAA family ATPase [Cereibacter sphaeroides]
MTLHEDPDAWRSDDEFSSQAEGDFDPISALRWHAEYTRRLDPWLKEQAERRARDADACNEGREASRASGVIIPKVQRASRFMSAAELAGLPIPERKWLVRDLVPARNVTLIYGDGGTGKSLLSLQLAVAVVLGSRWIGREVTPGRAVFFSAEDEKDELHCRLADILRAEQAQFEDIRDLTFRSLAGEDALLASFEGAGKPLIPSSLCQELDDLLAELKPQLLVLDTLADLFPGNENDKAQARQFVGILKGLAIRHDCAVVMLAHPSLSGMASGNGTSGNVAWSGSARSRLYFERIAEEGYEADPDARVLRTMKANYGPKGGEIAVTWRNGVFVADPAETGLDRMAATAKAERVFLKLLAEATGQGRRVNHAGGPTYAPKVFAASPGAEGVKARAFRSAMEALIHNGKVRIAEDGPPSKRRQFLEVAS